MALITKDRAKVGKEIFIGMNDFPLDMPHYNTGVITEVFDDHYLYTDTTVNIDKVWGFYDDELDSSLVVFETLTEVKKWLKRGRRWNL